MQKKKGISLIVLVITIIVMIILAATIIISINNANVMNKANEAVESTDLATVKSAADLEYAEYLMNKPDLEGETLGDYLTEKLVKKGTITGDDYYIAIYNNQTVVVKAGSLAYEYYKGNLKVGDYVNYDSGNNSEAVKEYTGSLNNVTITSSSNLKWQVLGVNGNVVNLVLEGTITPEGKSGISLYGAYGYLKGEELLDNACKVFGMGYGAAKARSIKIEDVEKIIGDKKTGYMYPSYMPLTGQQNYYGIEYGKKLSYDGTSKATLPVYNLGSQYNTVSVELPLLTQPDLNAENYISEKPMTLQQTAYSYVNTNNLENEKIIFDATKGLKDYWLSSKSVGLGVDGIEYGMFSIYIYRDSSGLRGMNTLLESGLVPNGETLLFDEVIVKTMALRPVVELKGNIMCEKVADSWNLK